MPLLLLSAVRVNASVCMWIVRGHYQLSGRRHAACVSLLRTKHLLAVNLVTQGQVSSDQTLSHPISSNSIQSRNLWSNSIWSNSAIKTPSSLKLWRQWCYISKQRSVHVHIAKISRSCSRLPCVCTLFTQVPVLSCYESCVCTCSIPYANMRGKILGRHTAGNTRWVLEPSEYWRCRESRLGLLCLILLRSISP